MAQAKAVLEQLQSGTKDLKPLQMAWFQTDPRSTPQLIEDYNMPTTSGNGFTRLSQDQAINLLKQQVDKKTNLSSYDQLLQTGSQEIKDMLTKGSATSSKYVNLNGVMYNIANASKLVNATPAELQSQLSLMGTRQKETANQEMLNTQAKLAPIVAPMASTAQMVPTTQPQQVTQTPQSAPTSLQQQVDSTNSSLVANKDYVNAVFKAYHGRDANAQELQQFTGQKVGSVRDTIKAGAPNTKLSTPTFSGGEVTQPVDASKVSDFQLTDFLTGVSQGKDAAGSFISSLSSANLITQLSEGLKSDLQTQAEQGLSSSLAGLQDIGTALDQKKTYSQSLFGSQGYDIQGKVSQLNQLQLQSAQLTADYLTGRSQIGQQPIPMDLIVGQQKALDEQAAIKIGLLNAQAAAMTDNISLSQSLIDQMVNIQFGDLDARLQVTQSMINTYKDIASFEESKTMMKVQTILDERKQQLAEQKDQKTQMYNLVLDVAKAGGDTSKVKIDGTLEEAVNSAAPELSRLAKIVLTKKGTGTVKDTEFQKELKNTQEELSFYKNSGMNREDIEQMYVDAGVDVPATVAVTLDSLYGKQTEEQSWWSKTLDTTWNWFNTLPKWH